MNVKLWISMEIWTRTAWKGEKKSEVERRMLVKLSFEPNQIFMVHLSLVKSFSCSLRYTYSVLCLVIERRERTAKKLLKMFFWLLEFDMTQMGWHAIGNFQKQFQKIQKSVFRLQLRFSSEREWKNKFKTSFSFFEWDVEYFFWFVCLSSFRFCECLKNSILKCLFLRLFHYFKSFLFEFGRSNCIDIFFWAIGCWWVLVDFFISNWRFR